MQICRLTDTETTHTAHESAKTDTLEGILLLGGSGFIGTRLAELLHKNSTSFQIGDLRRSEAFPDRWTYCDVRRPDFLDSFSPTPNVIINFAAEHRDDVHPARRYYETNVEAASRICSAARSKGIQKIVFTSSVAVYGFQPFAADESGPFEPFNEYGKTKLAAEQIYRSWAAEDPSRTLIIVRPAVVFGEGNRGNVYNLLNQIASGRFLMVGSGENAKSMAYVGNVAAFLIHSLSLPAGEHVFNYVDKPDMTTRDLIDHVCKCIGRTGNIRSIPKAIALAGAHVLDITARITNRKFPISAIRIRKFCERTQFRAEKVTDCGFRPPFDLKEGLTRTIKFEFGAK